MPAVRYEAPRSIAQAIGLLRADPGAAILAGGTDLLVQCRAGMKRPTTFVDVKQIPELVGITVDEAGLTLGAATCAAELCEHAEVRRLWPGLVEAAHLIGSTQMQGRGSIGGNLCNGSPAADTTCALIVNRAECVIPGLGAPARPRSPCHSPLHGGPPMGAARTMAKTVLCPAGSNRRKERGRGVLRLDIALS